MDNKDILEISAISYTDKDFGAIYPEMLDLAKQLTNKWDPSKSDESDPGLVLLKEAAFVADHNNYNIDKNILENFLPSATQDKSVRNITEMNGYTPRYYVSATGSVTVTLSTEDTSEEQTLTDIFTIPAFTLVVSDSEETISYTQVEDIAISGKGVGSAARFIEGTLQTLAINDSGTITLENLDDNNRVYLPETMVAQNGIYVRNVNSDDYEDLWERNNYLLTQPSGLRIYKVDYDSNKDLPYIEFPSDISNLIGDGLSIQYISTSGKSGNISAHKLTKVLSPTTYEDLSKNVRFAENLSIDNSASITNGKDPETIDEMYRSFKKIVGTFDTLVTCKDYSNKVYELTDSNDNPIVSNVYVTDRRNDYNKSVNVISYDIKTRTQYFKNISIQPCSLKYAGLTRTTEVSGAKSGELYTYIYENEEGDLKGDLYVCTGSSTLEKADTINLNDFSLLTSAMTPYDLVIYALKAFSLSDYISGDRGFALNKSFTPVTDTVDTQIKNAIEDTKCICHTYKDHDSDEVFCFKNYAPIEVEIVPYNKVTEREKEEIITNVCQALSSNFNAREVEFGERLNQTAIEETIALADTRIKRVILSKLTYNLRAMDHSGNTLPVVDNQDIKLITDLVAKNVLAGRVCLFNFDDDFVYDYGQIGATDGIIKSNKIETELPIEINEDERITYATEQVKRTPKGFYSDGEQHGDDGHYNIECTFNAPNFLNDDGERQNLAPGASYILKSTKDDDGKDVIDFLRVRVLNDDGDVISESIYESKDSITCIIENRLNGYLPNTNKSRTAKPSGLELKGNLNAIEEEVESSTAEAFLNLDYTLKENEAVQIIYPNFYSEYTYGMYVNYKYIGKSTDVIYANTEHTLTADEKIVLIYTADGSTIQRIIEPGEVVNTSFNITPTNLLQTKGVKKSWTDTDGTFYENDNFRQMTTNQTISIRKQMNTVFDNTGIWCYWMINSEADGTNRLFSVDQKERILRSDEYFIYTNSSLNEIMIMGAGTKLSLENAPTSENASQWKIDTPIKTITTISQEGTSADIPWQKAIDFINNPLTITEMNVVTLGENDEILISDWTSPAEALTNDFVYCNGSITYITNNTQNVLPKISNFYQIKSRLDINMSSDSPQKLLKGQKMTIGSVTLEVTSDKEEDAIYIQSSEPIAAIGSNVTFDDEYRFYSYKKDGINYVRNLTIASPESKPVTSAEYNFYHDKSGIYLLPMHITDNDRKITVKITDESDTAIEFYDYPHSDELATEMELEGNASYYICPNVTEDKQLKVTLTWDYIKSSNEAIAIDNITVIDREHRMNPDLKAGSANIDDILDRILEIIDGSDSPSTKPYYPYKLDNSIAMDNLDFSDSNAMWDVNNVANKMTIAQLDINESDIFISSRMIRV